MALRLGGATGSGFGAGRAAGVFRLVAVVAPVIENRVAAMRSVLWFLHGTRLVASSRLHGYLIHESFVSQGYQSAISYSPLSCVTRDLPAIGVGVPSVSLEGTVSMVQKLRGANTDRLIDWLRANGSKVVYVNCDLRPGNQTWRKADRVFVPSEKMREYHLSEGAQDVRVVKEPYEYAVSPERKIADSGKLVVAWFGNREHWQGLQAWKAILEEVYGRHLRVITCSDHPDATYPWSFENQRRVLSEAAFVIIPTGCGEAFMAKSPNRLLQSFAVSAPVIAGPLPSYSTTLSEANDVTGRTCGFIVHTRSELCAAVEQMLDARFRECASEACFRYVEPRYSLQAVADDWASNMFDEHGREVSPRQHALALAQVRLKLRTGVVRKRIVSVLPWRVRRFLSEF